MSSPLAFPLDWPLDVPRRRRARVARFGDWTIARAVRVLLVELERLGVDRGSVVVSTNLELRTTDGLPRSNQRNLDDPAAAVYWRKGGGSFCLPCDAWTKVEHNLRAIALHVDALRGLERWGVGTSGQAFAGYAALPPPGGLALVEDWAAVFGVDRNSATANELLAAFRAKAKRDHPDCGGDARAFARLVELRDLALQELGA